MGLIKDRGAAKFTKFGVRAKGGSSSAKYLQIVGARGTPEMGTEGSTFDIPEFGAANKRKGTGQGTLPDFELELNYIPGDTVQQVLSHCAGILQDKSKTTATVAQSGTGSVTQAFTPGQLLSFAVQIALDEGGDVAVFLFDATVAGFKFAPDAEDQSVGSVVLSLDDSPVGPSGTKITFDTPASVSFS